MEKLYTDDAYIIDGEGKRRGPYKTRFGSGNTLTFLDEALEIVVDTGYWIVRPLDDGGEMVFTVTGYTFQEGINRIPPQHLLTIENKENPKAEREALQKSLENPNRLATGDDHVVNIPEAFIELMERIDASDMTAEEKKEAKNGIKKLLGNRGVSAILGDASSGLLLLLD
ncbi:hypothetical protein [Sulfurovum mangrovi]|uniref:hypothetical protein n=1 Tax=Sulfurovum mangrovi TaxID=2893889 RepID=UPI001E33D4B0|nr:hypothetical protein [Sulfurovum mangrovi]UFH60041.1 hypothetical protein LN246_04135 [Sulfurovum mangrovi]